MVDVKACRICLVVNVPLYYLLSPPLKLYFHTLIGKDILRKTLPPYACLICVTQINKYYSFRERCLRGQNLLYDLLTTEGSLSAESIAQVNRESVALSLNIKSQTEGTIINFIHEDVKVKHEPEGKEENHGISSVNKMETDSISQLSSDDELNLKFCTRKKVVKKKNQNQNDKKNEDISKEIAETKTNVDISLTSNKRRGTIRVHKQRPRKTGGVDLDDDNVEEYAIIIPLTLQEQIEEIEKRKLSTNYLNARFKCNLCYKGYLDSGTWKNHERKHLPISGAHECRICKFRFKSRDYLRNHERNHETKYQCKICSFISVSTSKAKLHHRWHKGVTYTCEHCGKNFTKVTSYMSHVRIKHPSEYICRICGYSYITALGLKKHEKMMHKEETTAEEEPEAVKADDDLYCALCDIKFENNEALKRHVVMSTKHTNNDLPVGCRECGDWFSSTEEYRTHHRAEHPLRHYYDTGYDRKLNLKKTWPAPCKYCSEEMENGRVYAAHLRSHHSVKTNNKKLTKNHKCDICGKCFMCKKLLENHTRMHSGERPFKCGQCPKAFTSKTALKIHAKLHSDEKPYSCTVCMKGFKRSDNLERHFRLHTGEKPYQCETCGKAFNQSDNLKLHVRTVHLKLPAPYIGKSRQRRKKEAKK